MRYRLNNVNIGFKNFSGARTEWNAAGHRNFHVFFLNDSDASFFANLGFNVKYPKLDSVIEEDFERDTDSYIPRPHMKINVNMESQWPPKVALIKRRSGEIVERQLLDADTIGTLDKLYIADCDIEINDNHYNGFTTAYLSTLYAVVDVDDFYERYGI